MSSTRVRIGIVVMVVALLVAGASGGCGASSPTPDEVTAQAPAASPSPTGASPAAKKAPPMKTIGAIGGISWVSTAEYCRLMNEMVRDRLGPTCSAPIRLYSIPFGEFSKEERLASKGDWRPLRKTMIESAQRLERGGADFIVVASDTMNSTDGLIEQHVEIPVLDIVDVVGRAVQERGIKTVALLGTVCTMEEPFYAGRLEKRYGLTVVTPNEAERDYVNTVIFDELCAGTIKDGSREGYVRIIERLVAEEGAEGVILGCTEIPLLVKQNDVSVPVFDSTELHAAAAVSSSLGED